MTEVNVERMIQEREKSEQVNKVASSVESSKIRSKLMPNKKFLIKRGSKPVRTFIPPSIIQDIECFKQRIDTNNKFNTSIKNICYNVGSVPMKDQHKRLVLREELKNSDIINEYMDNNLCLNYLNNMNQHLKLCIEYGRCYLTALNS
jgi:hypothetical protein